VGLRSAKNNAAALLCSAKLPFAVNLKSALEKVQNDAIDARIELQIGLQTTVERKTDRDFARRIVVT
jgi:hypothetical protein